MASAKRRAACLTDSLRLVAAVGEAAGVGRQLLVKQLSQGGVGLDDVQPGARTFYPAARPPPGQRLAGHHDALELVENGLEVKVGVAGTQLPEHQSALGASAPDAKGTGLNC